jgi:hypothetical protein
MFIRFPFEAGIFERSITVSRKAVQRFARRQNSEASNVQKGVLSSGIFFARNAP